MTENTANSTCVTVVMQVKAAVILLQAAGVGAVSFVLVCRTFRFVFVSENPPLTGVESTNSQPVNFLDRQVCTTRS